MELSNIREISVKGGNISEIVTNQEQLQTCDETKSIATISVLNKLILEEIYPVGSVYISYTESSNPSDILGFGSWTKVSGRYIYAGGSGTGIGGENYIKTNMMPAHVHTIDLYSGYAGAHTHTITVMRWNDSDDSGRGEHMASHDQWGDPKTTNWIVSEQPDHTHSVSGNTGTTNSPTIKNLPAYQSFYVWYRTN